MSKCTGKKGNAKSTFASKVALAKARLKSMSEVNKEMIAAVYAGGNIYTINGCEGMNKAEPTSVRIISKEDDMYKVLWENSKVASEISREELSEKLEAYFDVKCGASHDKLEKGHEEDR